MQEKINDMKLSTLNDYSFYVPSGTLVVSGFFLNVYREKTDFALTLTTSETTFVSAYRTYTGVSSGQLPTDAVVAVIMPSSTMVLSCRGSYTGTLLASALTTPATLTLSAGVYGLTPTSASQSVYNLRPTERVRYAGDEAAVTIPAEGSSPVAASTVLIGTAKLGPLRRAIIITNCSEANFFVVARPYGTAVSAASCNPFRYMYKVASGETKTISVTTDVDLFISSDYFTSVPAVVQEVA